MKAKKNKRIDFSKGRHRQMLVWQRQQMWTDEAIERYAKWLNLKQGMTAVDIGCGLGFLGYAYWKFFGDEGRYIGVDVSPALLTDARKISDSWSTGGKTAFIGGNIYSLPLSDNMADLAMCQTLMIHLEKPKDALSEMVRILKPGGLILCMEPDNLRPTLISVCSSLPEHDFETQLLVHRVGLITNKGRINMGRGDTGIAPCIPQFLSELGMKDIDILARETVSFLLPPYKSERQKKAIKNMKQYWLNDENFMGRMKEQKEEFLAGGGDIKDFNRLMKLSKKLRKTQLEQIEKKEFFICSAYPFYIIKAIKTK